MAGGREVRGAPRRTALGYATLAAMGGVGAAARAGPGQGREPAGGAAVEPVALEMWTGTHPPHQVNWETLLPIWHEKQPRIRVTAMQQPASTMISGGERTNRR